MKVVLGPVGDFGEHEYHLLKPEVIDFVKHLTARWEQEHAKSLLYFNEKELDYKDTIVRLETLLAEIRDWHGPMKDDEWRVDILSPMQHKIENVFAEPQAG